MNNTDTSDNAATQFLLTTEVEYEGYSTEARALATIVGFKMWHEAIRRCREKLKQEELSDATYEYRRQWCRKYM